MTAERRDADRRRDSRLGLEASRASDRQRPHTSDPTRATRDDPTTRSTATDPQR
ncbi:hypothetical protein [Natrinema longum]|uniref:Uncharacterized protein n=1 Tax=Natrinema longum TaxID=370324 RepID=A0A8A2U6R4_9EURY|nr:hypothetical protein [Natrinema longum]MBZ6494578.1 hypothetical protein [Natrinema longum]QSW84102.1 hypothetical protein J0X27_11610 [Natrinema longum]